MMKKISGIGFIGEPMLELSEAASLYSLGVAGDTYNTAVYLKRLCGAALQVNYATGLGKDQASQKVLAALAREDIETKAVVQLADRSVGLYMITTDTTGERTFTYWRGEAAARFWLESHLSVPALNELSRMDALYLSGISLAILPDACKDKLLSFIREARDNGKTIIFDNNYRPRLWASAGQARQWYDQMLSMTDIALITEDDEHLVYNHQPANDIIQRCLKAGVKEVVLKRGKEPCLVATAEDCVSVGTEHVEKVIDTTAAGDSFGAGYLAARIQGQAPAEAAAFGHRLASVVIQHKGAIIPAEFMPV